MTLHELKQYIKSVCLAHKDINDFYIGSSYNEAEDITLKYPLVFYELPYLINYNVNPSQQVDLVQFAFNVMVDTNWDAIEQDHDSISAAKEIGDQIVTYIINDTRDFVIRSITAVSVRESDKDSATGMNFGWTIALPRTACDSGYADNFNPIDA